MKIRLTMTEELLGTKASNPNVFTDFIASKHPSGAAAPDEVESAAGASQEVPGSTLFHRDRSGSIGIYDYQVKGFFKDAISALNRMDKEHRGGMEKLSAFKTKIDGLLFVRPRFIVATLPPDAKPGLCERPLRAETMQGPRVSLARSETLPPGTALEFTLDVMSKDLEPWVKLALDYGKLRGLGQWRNSGKGRFEWEAVA